MLIERIFLKTKRKDVELGGPDGLEEPRTCFFFFLYITQCIYTKGLLYTGADLVENTSALTI